MPSSVCVGSKRVAEHNGEAVVDELPRMVYSKVVRAHVCKSIAKGQESSPGLKTHCAPCRVKAL
ncbi:hypothetical protein RI119_04735 [Bacillus amyloliquefaciens]|uniref:hypothetical protein n=1 Tax=Bacillus amyloliquefaciens TaxID=1390 RepID=UPI003756EE50